jgi:hypothetical protein
MTTTPKLVSVSASDELPGSEKERLQKLREVLGRLTPRNGPSEQAVKTALYDDDADTMAATILYHTKEGSEGQQMLEAILALEPSGKLARFLAAELKIRANRMKVSR